jgi:hypothetical protein
MVCDESVGSRTATHPPLNHPPTTTTQGGSRLTTPLLRNVLQRAREERGVCWRAEAARTLGRHHREQDHVALVSLEAGGITHDHSVARELRVRELFAHPTPMPSHDRDGSGGSMKTWRAVGLGGLHPPSTRHPRLGELQARRLVGTPKLRLRGGIMGLIIIRSG